MQCEKTVQGYKFLNTTKYTSCNYGYFVELRLRKASTLKPRLSRQGIVLRHIHRSKNKRQISERELIPGVC